MDKRLLVIVFATTTLLAMCFPYTVKHLFHYLTEYFKGTNLKKCTHYYIVNDITECCFGPSDNINTGCNTTISIKLVIKIQCKNTYGKTFDRSSIINIHEWLINIHEYS